jgi:hypothetical protein
MLSQTEGPCILQLLSGIAQLVEQLTVNQRVTGSSPVAGAMRILTFYDISHFQLLSRMLEASVDEIERDLLNKKFLVPVGTTHVSIEDKEKPYLSKIVDLWRPRF